MNKEKQKEHGTFINQEICQTRHNYLRLHFHSNTKSIFVWYLGYAIFIACFLFLLIVSITISKDKFWWTETYDICTYYYSRRYCNKVNIEALHYTWIQINITIPAYCVRVTHKLKWLANVLFSHIVLLLQCR